MKKTDFYVLWTVIRRHKKAIIIGAIIIASIFVVTGKGKNSLKNKLLRVADTSITFIASEGQHHWYRFADMLHGYDVEKADRIGWIADIHADRFKRRTVDSGTLFPVRYSQYVPRVFDELRRQGVTTVIADGDNTNSADEGYARELERIAYRKNMHIFWVKGNHDSEKVMQEFGFQDKRYYYYEDFPDARLVVLDNTQQDDDDSWIQGGFSPEQEQWLIETLKTDKKVIIAMHIPIFPVSLEDSVLSQYGTFEEILREHPNVRLVLNGHFHVKWEKHIDDIGYYGQSALTRESEEGAYGVIDLKTMHVTYSYAK